jgi:hypothetical protein
MDQMQWQMLQQALQSGAMGGASGMMGQAPMRMAPQMQEQQVPPGNPIAEYLQGRASNHATEAAASGLYGAGALTLGAANPYFLPFALPAAGVMGMDALSHIRKQGEMSGGADMWRERFGK